MPFLSGHRASILVTMCGRVVQSSSPLQYAFVDGMNVRDKAVPGVSKVVVSYKGKTAVVTYDDGRTDVSALTRATTGAGYPSAPRS